jgi:ATP-dependent Clp protease ATP-binding subunit ClpA
MMKKAERKTIASGGRTAPPCSGTRRTIEAVSDAVRRSRAGLQDMKTGRNSFS